MCPCYNSQNTSSLVSNKNISPLISNYIQLLFDVSRKQASQQARHEYPEF